MPAPNSFNVLLPSEAAAEALKSLARREFRHPRDQAAKLLVEALEHAGALPAEPADPIHRAAETAAVGASK